MSILRSGSEEDATTRDDERGLESNKHASDSASASYLARLEEDVIECLRRPRCTGDGAVLYSRHMPAQASARGRAIMTPVGAEKDIDFSRIGAAASRS